jgi:hypothetical protein
MRGHTTQLEPSPRDWDMVRKRMRGRGRGASIKLCLFLAQFVQALVIIPRDWALCRCTFTADSRDKRKAWR